MLRMVVGAHLFCQRRLPLPYRLPGGGACLSLRSLPPSRGLRPSLCAEYLAHDLSLVWHNLQARILVRRGAVGHNGHVLPCPEGPVTPVAGSRPDVLALELGDGGEGLKREPPVGRR